MNTKSDPLEEEVRTLVRLALKVPAGTYDRLNRESVPEWDSLKHIEIVFALEDRFGLQFDEQEIPGLTSLEAIVRSLRTHNAS